MPNARILALDICKKAVINTQENINANNLGSRVEVRESDLFSAITTD
jgi:methylase of polypeptide subunit release factors